MPRRSSSRSGGGFGRPSGGGRSYSTSRPSSSRGYSSGYRAAPSSPSYNTLQNPSRQGMGLGGMLATGMAFGGGSALAHQAVQGLMGRGSTSGYPNEQGYSPIDAPSTQGQLSQQEIEKQVKANPCFEFNLKFVDCLKINSSDIAKCQTLFNDVISCEKSMI